MLTETQILLLNNLIYRDEFSNPEVFEENEGKTVRQILERISNSAQQTLTEEEWDAIYAMAKSDDQILDLRVTNMNADKLTGEKMACFVDEETGQAYAVFAGTGANEWRDDCVAGTMIDSPQQQKALTWFESLPYDNIVVSGHSKGGNKAMYVSILSDKAGECYAFDGEGFSLEFCKEYEDKISAKKDKIHLRANYRDFVNVLLIPVAGDIKYVVNDEGVANAGEYHAPNALFKYENGEIIYEIGKFGKQDSAMEMLHNFTVYLLENASSAEKIVTLSVLGELLTKFLVGEAGVVREDILDMFQSEAIEVLLRYLSKYLRDLMISDPVTYFKYRFAFENFVGDASGGSFWTFLLAHCVVEPIEGVKLFDILATGAIVHIYKAGQLVVGGNVRGRDFSKDVKDAMINSAKEVEDEKWWQVTKWDCWYRVEKSFGGMQWDQYTGKVDEYYRKLIDINDASVKDIERIFENVYQLDKKYGQMMSEMTTTLEAKVQAVLAGVRDSIVPKHN